MKNPPPPFPALTGSNPFWASLDIGWPSCMISCMATKTISLELDAYEKLKRAKRGSESFSQVVRRGRFDAEESTGGRILEELEGLYASRRGVPEKTFTYWKRAATEDRRKPRISPNHWQ